MYLSQLPDACLYLSIRVYRMYEFLADLITYEESIRDDKF